MTGDKWKNCARRFAADAFLHLLELPQRDSHADTLPAAANLQKEKRRAEIIAAARFDFCPAGRNFSATAAWAQPEFAAVEFAAG